MKILPILVILLSMNVTALAKGIDEFDLNKSVVDVPWIEFKDIVERLTKTVEPVVEDSVYPPVDYVIRSLNLTGKVVDRKIARLTAKVDIVISESRNLDQNGWVTVPIGNDLSNNEYLPVLEEVCINGRSVPIQNSDGKNEVLFSKAGKHLLELNYFCPIKNYEGNWEISLDLPRAASAFINFTIPKTNANIFLNGVKQNAEINKGATVLKTALSLDQQITLKYSLIGDGFDEDFDTLHMAPKIFTSSGILVTIKENRVMYQCKIDYQIWHQKQKKFSVEIPDSLTIENVSGVGLTEWKIRNENNVKVIDVFISFEPKHNYTLSMDFSKKLETIEANVTVPQIKPLDADREKGFVAIQGSETMEVFAGKDIKNLTVVAIEELPYWLQNQKEILMRYKYGKKPYNLNLNVLRHKDMPVIVAIADEAMFTGIITVKGYNLVKYRYFIRNNHKQYLSLKMPEKWVLWSALIDGNAVLPASTENCKEVLIPLKKMSKAEDGTGFILELVYWNINKEMINHGKINFETPIIDINCQKIIGELWIPGKYEYKGFNGTIKNVDNYNSRYISTAISNNKNKGHNRNCQSNNLLAKSGRALSLPVEIEIPRDGKQLKFSKELTVSGEKSEVTFVYTERMFRMSSINKMVKLFLWLILFIITFFISRWALFSIKNGNRKIIIPSSIAGIISLLIINAVFALGVPLPLMTIFLAISFALISYIGSLSRVEGI